MPAISEYDRTNDDAKSDSSCSEKLEYLNKDWKGKAKTPIKATETKHTAKSQQFALLAEQNRLKKRATQELQLQDRPVIRNVNNS